MQGLLLISLLIVSTQALTNEGFLIPPPAALNPIPPSEVQGWFPNFTQLVTKLHYPVQTHKIITEDGYILTWFRIQAKNQNGMKEGLPVVLCMHGVGDSGDTFVVNEEKLSLGLLLANEGYDVWVGNVRGTKYGLKHTNKKIKKKDFWNFSWQDMSKYDLPAGFEYIHRATGSQNITYVGHSQGTVIMFAALAEEDPTVLKYLKNFVALAPVAYVSHVQSGILKYMANSTLGEMFLKLGMYSFLQPGFFESEMGHLFCKFLPTVCGNQLSKIYGFDPEFDNYKQINIILEHEPGGTSVVNLLHWKQLVHSGRFCKYDHGEKENMKRYGQKTPPDYDLSKIKMPVSMFFGKYDDIIGDEDSHLLIKALNGTSAPSFAKFYTADHMTWLWSKNTSFFYEDFINQVRGN